MSFRTFGLTSAILSLSLLAGCHDKGTASSSTPSEKDQAKLAKAEAKQQTLQQEADTAMSDFRQTDPTVDALLQRSVGYVIFPSVAKGGFIVGGAHGKGILYEKGRAVGDAELSQASVGFLAGGQSFRELIVFETPEVLEKFRSHEFSMGADVSAVALKSGVAGAAQFKNGIAVFVKPIGGAMFEASVAGQKISVKPM